MYTLPDLDYDYGALAPAISEDIMRLHHTKHHQAYVDKLNAALEGRSVPSDLMQLLRDVSALPEDVRQAVRNNGGGHLNHSLFWEIMSPDGGGEPSGDVAQAIVGRYGNFQTFVDTFNESATGLFGSGWVWLMPDMQIITSPNQDSPIMNGQQMPLLGLDVWEHAYYLDYKNQRDAYIKAWWNVVDWARVEARHDAR